MREGPKAAAPPQPAQVPLPGPALPGAAPPGAAPPGAAPRTAPPAIAPLATGPPPADEEPQSAEALGPVPRPSAGRTPLIAVDAMGGDHAPEEIVAGAVIAVREHHVRVALTGRPGLLRPLLARHDAADLIGVDAARSHSAWTRARCPAGADRVQHRRRLPTGPPGPGRGRDVGRVDRRHRGYRPAAAAAAAGAARPALAVVLPTRPAPTLLLDAGAIANPKPEMLVQFAQLGVAYAQGAWAWPSRASGC